MCANGVCPCLRGRFGPQRRYNKGAKKLLKAIEKVPFAANDYPITVAEVRTASKKMDALLSIEQRDELVDCLAFQPNVGEIISASSMVRRNVFEFEDVLGRAFEITVFFFFFDLNVPLYILAVFEGDYDVKPTEQETETMNKLAAKLVENQNDVAEKLKQSRARKAAQ